MCKACVDLLAEAFPEIPDDEYGDFLISCTAFPFGGPETIGPQLMELKSKMKTTNYKECYGIASEMNELDMEKMNEQIREDEARGGATL